MPTYQSPGVYVEEVPAGARPLEGVGTAIAAFVGLAESGPFNRPTLVSNWTQFTTTFGGFVAGSYLAQAVYGYFMNGGGNCYVVRIGQDPGGSSGPAPRSARAKQLASGPTAQIGRLKVTAIDPAVATRRGQRGDHRPGQATDPAPTRSRCWSSATVRSSRSSTEQPWARGKQNVVTLVNATLQAGQPGGDQQREAGAAAQLRVRAGRSAGCGCSALHQAERRRLRR